MHPEAENSRRSHLFGYRKFARFFSSIFLISALSSLLVVFLAPSGNSALLSSSTTATSLINPSGGSDSGSSKCATDSVVVGFRWSGGQSTTSPYSIYCRALNNDGTIPIDQSTISNTAQVTVYVNNSASNVTFCPAGKVATGVRHRGWSDFALICNTPPALNETPEYSKTVTSPTDRACAANSVLVGMGKYTGAWLDSLYGVCSPFSTITLTYNVNSGSGTAPAAVTQLTIAPFTISSSYAGLRSGFTFTGWNTLANGSGTFYSVGSSVSLSASLTLYAQWNSAITYDGNGKTSGAEPVDTIATGSAAITTLASNSGNLAKSGFTFGGWNTSADGSGTNYAAGLSTYASTGSRTLFAQWNSTITYNGNGQTSAVSTVPAATTAKESPANTTLASIGTLVKTGYTFSGWNTQADGLGTNYASGLTTYQSTGNITLYAKWTRTVTYNVNGAGSGSPERSTDVFLNSTTPTISTFPTVGSMVKTGYTFGGWSTTTTGTALTTPYSAASEITLYAVWNANNYAITFDANGGTGTMANSAIVAGTAKALTANTFARTGYTFNGWTTNADGTGTTYTNSQSITLYANTTLYAKWLARTFAVTFGNTPGTTGSRDPSGGAPAQSFTAGTPFSLSANVWYRTGYVFAGWSIIAGNGSPVVYADRATVTFFGDTNIVTQWNPLYTVTFNANSGTGTAPTAIEQSGFGSAITAPAGGTLARVGYTFGGWNTAANGSGTSYAVGAAYTPSASTTLYALWKILVTYSANNGTGTPPSIAEAVSGNLTVANSNGLSRANYTFGGWNTTADGTGTTYAPGDTFSTTISSTLYAQWNSTITYNGNTNTSGTVPNPTVAKSSNAATSLAGNDGNLQKTGYTFGGWNSAANGTGSNFPVPTPSVISETPYMHFFADNFNDATNAWTNNGNSSRSIPGTAVTASTGFIRGNPTLTTNTSGTNGSSKTFRAVKGTTLDGIVIGNQALPSYTFCHVARYAGSTRARIFAGVTGNWLSGYWSGSASVAYHEGWITDSAGNADSLWRVMCDTGGTPSGSSTLRSNGVSRTTVLTNTTGLPANVTINLNQSRTAPTEPSDWEVAEFYIFDSVLSNEKILQLEAILNQKYGLTGLTSSLDTFDYASNGNTTLYAQWNCAIIYAANGATSGSAPLSTPCVSANPVTLRANTGTLAKTGFNLIGWNTAADGSGTAYSLSANYVPTGDITLYAQWGSTITYNANTATSGTVPSPTVTTTTANLNLATNSGNLAKTGVVFAGWNTAANGTGTSYLPGAIYAPSGNLTLYALWLSNCTSTRTIVAGFVIETFATAGVCYWNVPATATSIDYLVVGAGGGGGSSLGGGGGGGQVISRSSVSASGGGIIKVGAGGAGGVGSYGAATNHGKKGETSVFLNNAFTDRALGGSGGNGRMSASNLNPDGSAISTGWTGGGGAYANSPAEIAIAGVGGNAFIGGNGSGSGGGGGGGAGGAGVARSAASNASSGGIGVSDSITGTATYYGGGGGASYYSGNVGWTGIGGLGGGGNGSNFASGNYAGGAGLANRGGGGGGGYDGLTGGNGGSGVVIVRYELSKPSAPTITAITPTSGQLSIAFTPPITDGGTSISNYQYSLDGGSNWITPSPAQSTSPLIVTGLANGTTFPVVIRAFNGKEGVNSNLVSATTPLSAPTISAVAGNANATITVTAGAGATPTSYLVTALNNSGVALAGPITCTVTAPSTSCVISGLTNNTAYKFSAVAYKSSLTSPVSNVTAAVTPTSYTITYNGNNSTTNTTAEFTTGTPLILPTPVKNGYNFNGWFTASTGGTLVGQNGSSYSPAATGTLHAQWTGISYAITYNSNGSDGGSAPANGTFTTGSTAYSIAAFSGVLTKSGYTLTGWNTAANGSGIDYGPGLTNTTYSLSANLTLFAKWSYTNFSVTYALNGGTGTLPTSGTKTISETFTVAAATGLSKPGFSFGGWNDGTNTYRAGSVYTVGSANVTLTARWIALYLITFDKNGATSGSAPSGTTYVAGDTGISLPTAGGMSKSGYIFDGWSTTPTGSLATSPFTTNADVTLYAKWSLATISITFSAGLAGGVAPTLTSLPATTSAAFGSLFTLPTTDTATTTSAGNFVLVGWNDGSSTYRPGDTYRVTAVPPTFTAQWVAIYTVRYSLNGGSSAVPADATYINNTGITTAAIPSRTGYNFLNWIDQSNETVGANAAYTVRDGHYLLYAVWSPIAYNITFSDNSVAGVSGIPAVQTGNLGEIVSLNSNKPSRAGYLFSNWTTNADGSGLAYGAGSQLILGSADVTLYAQWSAATNTIIYSGTITSGALPSAQGAATGATAVLAASTGFTRTGYTFDKWSDGIDLYAAGADFTMPAANTLITAQWILNAPNTPAAPTVVAGDSSATITIVPGSGNGGPATSYVVTAAPGGATCTVYSPATTCSISGLDNGTAYTFTSVAHNNSGSAGPSAPSNAVIPATKPTLVTSVSAVAGNTNAVVTFTAPSNNGGAEISSYTVTASPGGFTCVLNAPFTTPLTCTVPGLSNGVAYTFTVSASNGAYTSDASASSVAVTPKTVPGAPTLSAATSSTTSPGSATVTVTSPGSNGGDAIISYTVTSSPGGFTCTVLAPNTSCIVEGLTPGVAYTFTAVARNSVPGTSAASVASNSITPVAKPSAPTNVIAAAGDEEVTVSFTAPSANGSPITSYKVIALTIDGVPISPEKSCTPTGNATSCTITGLDNERPYTFSVTATNAVDTSFASTASAVTTPKDRFPPNLLINGPPSGIDIVGSVLTSVAIFEGAPEPVVTYQWQRCSSETDLTTCAAISGATAATYTTVSTDEGKFIRVVATATNGVSPNAVATSPLSAEITGPPRATTPTTGITANVNESYSLATVAFGGLAPIIYAITSGVLPAGLTFDTFTGNITGTPITVGNATLVISATDQKNQSSSITFTLTVVDPNAAAPVIPTAPVNNSTAGSDAAAKAAAEKAIADAAAKAAAEKAAAEAVAKLAAEKAAAEAAAKAAADRAAAAAAAKLAADKIAAAQAAQVAADKAAASAAQKIATATAAQAAAQSAATKAADLAKAPTVSSAAKQLAAAAAAAAKVQAAAAVKNAAAAAASEVAAKNAVVAAAKEVTISIGSLNSATATAAKSSTADIAAAAAKNAAELSAKAAAGEALAAKSAANAAARIASDAVTRAAAQQKAAAIAAELSQKKAQELAIATAEKAAAEKDAQKAAATLAVVLEEQSKLSDQLALADTAEERALAQKLLTEIEKKVDLAQDAVDDAIKDASEIAVSTAKLEQGATQAAQAVQTKIKAAENANKIAQKANTNSEKATALSIVAENAATSAKKVAKTIPRKAPKPVAPPVAANAPRSDALINISGLKPGQKIRVSVKVNIK